MYDTGGFGYYINPNRDISRVVLATSVTGTVLSFSGPAPNSSYTLEYIAPALQCTKANNTISELISSKSSYHFVSWVPWSGIIADDFYRIANMGMSNTTRPTYLDQRSKDHARIFAGGKKIAVECGLFNASYKVGFEFSTGVPYMQVHERTLLQGIWNDPIEPARRKPYPTQLFNYLAIMEAFGEMMTGTIMSSVTAAATPYYSKFPMTVVALANDLQYPGQEAQGISALGRGRNFTLAEGLEELFHNITFSLFASPQFLSPRDKSPLTEVTITSPQNLYRYQPRNLWLSYGIALFFATFGVLLGIVALLKNGAAFANDFSTVVRVTRNPELLTVIQPQDTTGTVPVGKHLQEVKLGMSHFDIGGQRLWGMEPVVRSSVPDEGGTEYYGAASGRDGYQPSDNAQSYGYQSGMALYGSGNANKGPSY